MSTALSFGQFERDGWEDVRTARSYDEHMAVVTTQSVDALLDDAGVLPGMRVLDVATGAGYVAAAAARRGAVVTGIDFSATQVGLARARYPDLDFRPADAEALPFDVGTFDAVVCAFGLCHLPYPELALSEACRVLKPGRRVAFSVWDIPSRAVGLGAVYEAIRKHGTTDVGLPVGPNFFHFSDSRQSIEALREAGFESPIVRCVDQHWQLDAPGQLYEIIMFSTVRAAATLGAQTAEARVAIKAELAQIVVRCAHGASFLLPMPAVLVSAIRI